jgi:hypothetical protein
MDERHERRAAEEVLQVVGPREADERERGKDDGAGFSFGRSRGG